MKTNPGNPWLLLVLAMSAAFGLAAIACSDDDEAGSDEDYVKAVCQATSRFVERSADFDDEVAQIMADADNEAEGRAKVLELTVEPVSDFANDLEKANPPADVKEFHDQVVGDWKALAKAQEDGDLEAYGEAADGFTDFEAPQAVRDRLNAVAASNSECADGGFFS